MDASQCLKGLSNVTSINGEFGLYGNSKLHMCSDLYAQLSQAANSVSSQNDFVERDDCNHACAAYMSSKMQKYDTYRQCGFGPFGVCSQGCGGGTMTRSRSMVPSDAMKGELSHTQLVRFV